MRWWSVLGVLVALPAMVRAERAADPPEVSFADAKVLLSPTTTTTCTTIPCLIEQAYARDDKARTLALALFEDTGNVAGVGPKELMDGGFRGPIQLVPQLPLGKYRKHLAWTSEAMHSIDTFFATLFEDQKIAPSYRWRALSLRYVRSVGKRTPSAYAFGWTMEYNVEGSLLTTAGGVLETIVHELFHLNDFAHSEWSATTLQQDYDAIVARCGTKASCLEPYAPNRTKVRATGTYYAFQPNNGNGVHEYAAELAVRYFTEQSQMMHSGKLTRRAFKCGPAENARAWQALVDEFFAGRDLVPAC
ncbi:MAG: hypothetical protein JWP01_3346 [Myxococcales bacterium]|nr:hypothetical protein [Myxococcales bacterium]